MLVRFIISNFLSFDKETEFNMLAGAYRTHKHHIHKTSKLNILKGTALYGANGAGKSNFVKAIDYLQKIVSAGKIERSINSKKFKLNKVNLEKPVIFEIEFIFKRKTYAYSVTVDGNTVQQEWLYLSGIDKEDKLIFERKTNKSGKSSIKFSDKYTKTQKQKLLIELMEDTLLKSDELLIGKFEALDIIDLHNIYEWFNNYLIIIYPHSKFGGLVPSIMLSDEFALFTNEMLSTFDTGVKALAIEDIELDVFFGNDDDIKQEIIEALEDDDDNILMFVSEKDNFILAKKEEDHITVKKITAVHHNKESKMINFDLSEESDGTLRLLDFIPAIYSTINKNATIIIDEIDQSLHPALLYTLVKKIMATENTKGQVVFTTHESNLLDLNIFRQDEIWFAEKDKTGASQLYPLSDFNPRYDLDVRKGYLKGRFGAIPFTADLKNLNWELHDA